MVQKPVLSIGMIFKNEIRCLERCMKSLQPLREAIPCELVMADTGSDDGSREVAAKYADILFDFPWINDFSAARNAVMDRCSGEWFLTVDADEWLDEDFTELTGYLRAGIPEENSACTVVQRNYTSYDTDFCNYSDFFAIRMLRMSTGLRYNGAIHEGWDLTGRTVLPLRGAVLKHDGYVSMNIAGNEEGEAKRRRNMELLREKLEKEPHDLVTLQQCIESSDGAEHLRYIRLALKELDRGNALTKFTGPIILRHAVSTAKRLKLPELWDYVDRAERQFPNSIYTRTDIMGAAAEALIEEKKYAEAIPRLESYLTALEDYRAGRFDVKELMRASFGGATPATERRIRLVLANAYFEEKRYEEAMEALEAVDGSKLEHGQVGGYISILLNLQGDSDLDLTPCVTAFWEQITSDKPEWTAWRKQELASIGIRTFGKKYREKEVEEKRPRHAYMLFLPLAEEYELGAAAAVLESDSPEEISRLLGKVEKWDRFPAEALQRALECGTVFPLPDRPMNVEDMDILASGLCRDPNALYNILQRTASDDFAGSWQDLVWTRGLALAAVRTCDWKKAEQEGFDLAQAFATAERAFLPACYTPEVLENLCALPPMHRFGWHCVQAFDALEAGDAAGYVRFLRAGLESNPAMKDMVEYLIDNTPGLLAPEPSPELLVLAEKVRTMLAAYPPDDPAVAAVKASPAYQKVAYLIEGGRSKDHG